MSSFVYVGQRLGFVNKAGREVRPEWSVRYRDVEKGPDASPWRLLPARRDLADHSPDGFAWGYGGSGPAQLALALVAHATGQDSLALSIYQDFKHEIIAGLPRDGDWEITSEEVLETVTRLSGLQEPGR
jgi:hypothetical protein